MNRPGLVAASAVVIGVLVGTFAPAALAEADPLPPAPPPGWVRTDIPYVYGPDYSTVTSVATSWCEGHTRVHALSPNNSGEGGAALALETNAATCGGSNP